MKITRAKHWTDAMLPRASNHSGRQPWPWLKALLAAMLLLGINGCSKQEANPASNSPPRRREFRQANTALPAQGTAPDKDDEQPSAQAHDPGSDKGLVYSNEWIRRAPWSVNLLKIDRHRRDFQLTTALGRGKSLGLATLTDQLEALPPELGEPVAAINGDFYRTEQESYAGDPRGVQIARGEIVSAPNGKTAFWIDTDGKPSMGDVASAFRVTWPSGEQTPFGLNEERRSGEAVLFTSRQGLSTRTSGGKELLLVRSGDSPWLPLQPGTTYRAEVKSIKDGGNSRLAPDAMVLSLGPALAGKLRSITPGTILQLSTATLPDLKGVQTAIGGGPVLLHQGKVQPAYANKSNEPHPRTAFGWNDQYYYFLQVDGRQHGFSMGMTLAEVARYLSTHGCQEAMNLDGGGSAEMWVEGRIVNRPCFGYERQTANALVVVRKENLADHSQQP